MAVPGLGDAITLFDLSVRVTTFINDLRHAQDDFISLRSEADCLRICLGSLTSESCQNALYHYITIKQGQDLKQIVNNCKFNMMDLNSFIAKCAKLGDNGTSTAKRNQNFFKKIGKAIGKGFTKYKFVMTDKQAFRDKLVLPTASINVFLTSLTHVGLVNMGRIMISTGHASFIPSGGKLVDSDDGNKSPVITKVDTRNGWQAVGRRIAFRDTIVKKSDLTKHFEDEMLEYALHLIRGGAPFHAKTASTSSTTTKHKVTKTTHAKTRSRSRSRGPLGLGKGGRGQMYVTRKKSVSIPATEGVEIVTREWESGSDTDGQGRHMLALPAPESSSSRQYVEIKPDLASSSDGGSNHENDRRRDRNDSPRRRQRGKASSHSPPRRQPTTSREEIRTRRRDIRETIRAEQEDSILELEQEEELSRTKRSRTRMSRPQFHSRAEEVEYERLEEEDDVISFLADNYGVLVQPLPEPREPVDNGVVKDIPPPTASGDKYATSESDGSDSPEPRSPPLRSRSRTMGGRPTNDRLRAQTYGGGIRFAPSSAYAARFQPYPSPYGPGSYRTNLRPTRYSDEFHNAQPDDGSRIPGVYVDGQYVPFPERRTRPRPRPRPHHYGEESDSFSDDGGYASRRPPRPSPSGPSPSAGADRDILISRRREENPPPREHILSLRPENDQIRGVSSHHRPEPVHRDPGFEILSENIDERREYRRSRPQRSGDPDVYMRGARTADGSNPSDDEDNRIEIIRS